MQRVHNFNAGPSAMPLAVLQKVQAEFLDFAGTGMSIVEISHRSERYQQLQEETKQTLRRLLHIPDGYHIIFLQGGGSLQFVMHSANFLRRRGAYVNTGVWSDKAMAAAAAYGEVYEAASSKKDGFSYIPRLTEGAIREATDYLYITSNNTIHGTQWASYPKVSVPLFGDVSSDFLSRPIPIERFDFLFAGAQKNIGPAGVVVAIIKDSLVAGANPDVSAMLRYDTYVKHDSVYNTPPVFAIYFIHEVLQWLEREGGPEEMARRNERKAAMIYEVIDDSDGFYRGHADKNSRSRMNITFNLPTPAYEEAFIRESEQHHFVGLKGHRSLGGCRASLYNAVTEESCTALAQFMKTFRKNH